jgi:hypothetical protein
MGLIRYFVVCFAVACAFGPEKVSSKKEKPTSIVQRLERGESRRCPDFWWKFFTHSGGFFKMPEGREGISGVGLISVKNT